jgi:hypothetical protein
MTHHQFCGHYCKLKALVISRYANYSLGESVLALFVEVIRSENMGECQEGVGGGGDLPRPK